MMLIVAINMPVVQTYLVGKLTTALSTTLGTKVSIGHVNFSFFNNLALSQVYVEDHAGDTLLYVEKLNVSLSGIEFSNKVIRLGTLSLENGEFNLFNDHGVTNVQNILDRLKNEQDTVKTKSSFNYSVKLKNVELDNFRFTMKAEPKMVYDSPLQVNFTDLKVDSIYVAINGINLKSDTLFFDISKLQFVEKTGFRLHNLTANGYVCSKQAMLKNIELRDDYSNLKLGYFSLNFANSSEDLKDYVHKVRMDGDFRGGYVSFKTIGYFAPVLAHIKTPLVLNGLVTGTVENLKTDMLYIATLDSRASILLSARMYGLPEINETSLHADIKNLYGEAPAVIALINDFTGGKANTSDIGTYLNRLQTVSFKGKFTGLYNDFVASGQFITSIGNLAVNALFTSSPRGIRFSGKFSAVDFNVGRLVGTPLLGRTTFDLSLGGAMSNKGSLSTSAEGRFALLQFNRYDYTNITLAGSFDDRNFNGSLQINDPNVVLDFVGKLFFAVQGNPTPEANFTLRVANVNLYPLHLNNRDSLACFSGTLRANFKGEGWKDGVGIVSLSQAIYSDKDGDINLGEFVVSAEQGAGAYRLALMSDYLDATLQGTSTPGKFVEDVKHMIGHYLPSVVSYPSVIDSSDNSGDGYRLFVNAKRTGVLTRIFLPELFIAGNSTVEATLSRGKVKLDVTSSRVFYGDIQANNVIVKSSNTDSKINAYVHVDKLNVGSGLYFKDLTLDANAARDTAVARVTYNNGSGSAILANNADVTVQAAFASVEDKTTVMFSLKPSQVVVNNIPWQVACAGFSIDSTRMYVDNFVVHHNDQKLVLSGAYSQSETDTLRLSLNNFDLSHANYFLQEVGYELSGSISGEAMLIKQFERPLFFANLNVKDVFANEHLVGDMMLYSKWNSEAKELDLRAQVVKEGVVRLNVSGGYSPENNFFSFRVRTKELDLSIVQPFLTGVLSDLQGTFTGNYFFQGKPGSLALTGEGELNDVSLRVDFLNTTYKMKQGKVISKVNDISMENVHLEDEEGNSGTLGVSFAHSYFKKFTMNLAATYRNLLVMNTTLRDNDLFYGKGYMSGSVHISGLFNTLDISVNATTEKNTKLFIGLPSGVGSGDSGGLLTFYKPPPTEEGYEDEDRAAFAAKQQKAVASDMSINLNIMTTTDAEANIVIDARSNDVLVAAGSGLLKMEIRPARGIFRMSGEYTVDRGSYTLTIPNFALIKRDFTIDRGGTVMFSGNINQTTVDIKASYDKLLRVSISPILPTEEIRARFPVVIKLAITGSIMQPTIKPIIEVKNINTDVEAKLQTAMNTDERLFRQFLSLLVIGQFTPEGAGAEAGFGDNAGLVNIADVLSSQLSSLLSEFNLPIDIGVSYRAGVNGNDQEIEVDWSGRITDKILISGTLGNATRTTANAGTTSTFTGDFEVEYILSPSFRLRGFSQSVDPYSDFQDGSRYGGAILYQKRFASFKDMFRSKSRREAREARKAQGKDTLPAQDSITGIYVLPDSTIVDTLPKK